MIKAWNCVIFTAAALEHNKVFHAELLSTYRRSGYAFHSSKLVLEKKKKKKNNNEIVLHNTQWTFQQQNGAIDSNSSNFIDSQLSA